MEGLSVPDGNNALAGPEKAAPLHAVELKVLQAAIEATNEAVLITSADLDRPGPLIEYANPAFTRLTGHEAHEILGRCPRLLQGPLTERAVLDRMRTALTAGETFQGEAVNYRKDGSTYFVEWLITPVPDAEGRIAHWISAQRDISERRAAEDRQEFMVRELHHRVKNTLATVQAVLNATMRSSLNIKEFGRALTGRIASLAKTHALITEDQAQAVSFLELLRTALQAYDNGRQNRLTLQGPPLLLPSELAVPIGMALHELTTNAITHGALAEPEGRIEVTWTVENEPAGRRFRWQWNEHDGPPVPLPTREGFGSKLLNRVLTAQIGAEVDIAFEPDGLRVTVDVPFGQEGWAERSTGEPWSARGASRTMARTDAIADGERTGIAET